ncbi:MAG: NAD(P)H-hydrate dehydratase, partial [Clostridia bacterium]|nr:NAD(P)H-hydrate dehydratase [Clostridia bacterium]
MILNKEFVSAKLPKRLSYQNKGDFGHVLIIGGSVGMSGSVCMTANAAMRSGAGLVTVAVPSEIVPVVSTKTTEAMVLLLPSENGMLCLKSVDTIRKFLPKVNTVVVGMGARICDGLYAVLEMLLVEFMGTLIVDADGLNVLSRSKELLDAPRKCNMVLTPHPGEMSRLLSLPISEIQSNREVLAKEFAFSHKTVVVLKGENTVITDGDELYVNPTGN